MAGYVSDSNCASDSTGSDGTTTQTSLFPSRQVEDPMTTITLDLTQFLFQLDISSILKPCLLKEVICNLILEN